MIGAAPLGMALRRAQAALAHSPSPRLDAEVLLAHVLGVARTYLVCWPEDCLAPTAAARYASLIAARARGVPTAQLTGSREFWSLSLRVTRHTLTPRPETELLVTTALNSLPANGRLLDLGTGTGAAALAVAAERPDAGITALERDPEALAVAAVNRRRHSALGVELRYGDWEERLAPGAYDVIIANPPYLAHGDPALAHDALRFEPSGALVADNDGLAALAAIVAQAPKHLSRHGTLAVEHGGGQGVSVRGYFARAGFSGITTHHDLQGLERVTVGRR